MPVAQLRTFRPSICNRLDRNTSGLVVAGRSLAGLQVMNAVFKDRSIHKYYQCIVKGHIEERQLIAGFLRKDEEKNTVTIYPLEVEDSVPIMTEYLPLAWGGGFTQLQVTLITGRSHQIRAHLASIGHPIAGDFKYGDRSLNEELKTVSYTHLQPSGSPGSVRCGRICRLGVRRSRIRRLGVRRRPGSGRICLRRSLRLRSPAPGQAQSHQSCQCDTDHFLFHNTFLLKT